MKPIFTRKVLHLKVLKVGVTGTWTWSIFLWFPKWTKTFFILLLFRPFQRENLSKCFKIFFFPSRNQFCSHLPLRITLHMVQPQVNKSARMILRMPLYKPMLIALSRASLKDLTLLWEKEDKCFQVIFIE